MIWARSSFRMRLAIGAVLWISIGFAFSWLVLGNLLSKHILREFSGELVHHATELQRLTHVAPDGTIRIDVPLSDFRFSVVGSGYYWQVDKPGGAVIASDSLGTARLVLPDVTALHPAFSETRGDGPTGETLLDVRLAYLKGDDKTPYRIAVAVDTRLIRAYSGSLERALAIAMASLATGLIFAAFAQIIIALQPLGKIELALLKVQRGEARRMPSDFPTEVRPLVESLNALLDKNEAMVQRARLEAGNLAHALKSSLAHLQIETDAMTARGQSVGVIQQQCDLMRRQIDYQLARARATASRIGQIHASRIGPVIENLISALRRLHRDRPITIEASPAHMNALVHCGSEDLEEILGNLIDNAAKWAASRVLISVTPAAAGKFQIRVEDDGPGMPADAHERVFEPGERLDESTPGSGLGLAIARDIVRLYDGRLWIDRSDLGGACVVVEV